jgi:hypothetical protein
MCSLGTSTDISNALNTPHSSPHSSDTTSIPKILTHVKAIATVTAIASIVLVLVGAMVMVFGVVCLVLPFLTDMHLTILNWIGDMIPATAHARTSNKAVRHQLYVMACVPATNAPPMNINKFTLLFTRHLIVLLNAYINTFTTSTIIICFDMCLALSALQASKARALEGPRGHPTPNMRRTYSAPPACSSPTTASHVNSLGTSGTHITDNLLQQTSPTSSSSPSISCLSFNEMCDAAVASVTQNANSINSTASNVQTDDVIQASPSMSLTLSPRAMEDCTATTNPMDYSIPHPTAMSKETTISYIMPQQPIVTDSSTFQDTAPKTMASSPPTTPKAPPSRAATPEPPNTCVSTCEEEAIMDTIPGVTKDIPCLPICMEAFDAPSSVITSPIPAISPSPTPKELPAVVEEDAVDCGAQPVPQVSDHSTTTITTLASPGLLPDTLTLALPSSDPAMASVSVSGADGNVVVCSKVRTPCTGSTATAPSPSTSAAHSGKVARSKGPSRVRSTRKGPPLQLNLANVNEGMLQDLAARLKAGARIRL